jgi:hypothetical protein
MPSARSVGRCPEAGSRLQARGAIAIGGTVMLIALQYSTEAYKDTGAALFANRLKNLFYHKHIPV